MCLKKGSLLIYLIVCCSFLHQFIWSQTPPTLIATGSEYYCFQSKKNIVTDFTIVNPSNVEITTVYIQISQGYEVGLDFLELSGVHPNVSTSIFNIIEGKLILNWTGSGTAITSELVAAVKNVLFSSTSTNPTTDKTFSITFGEANYLPSTGHYYQYIPKIGITWQQAKAEAEGKDYYGLKGYLATITSIEEAQLSGKQAAGAGWIGGSDAETEGVWKWVTGPEAGKSFWFGLGNGTTAGTDLPFAFWNISNNEPNQRGDEDYTHVTDPSIGNPGSWNDLSNTGGSSGPYQPKGYIIEYGWPGDLPLNISTSSMLLMPKITSTIGATTCGTGEVTLEADSNSSFILWFSTATGGLKIHTGKTYTPTISTTTTYYVVASSNGTCENGLRIPIVATVNTIPTITSVQGKTICENGTDTLSAVASKGVINWYSTSIGGTSLFTGANFTTPNLNSTTTYYVDATENGCTTLTRTPVTLTVTKVIAPTTNNSTQTFCSSENATLANLSVSGTGILWYATATGGATLRPSTLLLHNTTYYASQTVNSCESPLRIAVKALVYETPNPSAIIPTIANCDSNLVGTDVDGFENFDLTLNNSAILNGKNAADFNISFFTDAALIQPIPNPSNYKNATAGSTQKVYFKIEHRNFTNCKATGFFNIIVNPLPVLKNSIVTLEQCDSDDVNDGFSVFNLNEANELISTNYKNETFEFYKDAAFTQKIIDPIAYSNPAVINSVVYVKVKTINNCERSARINLKVGATQIPPNFLLHYYSCEDQPSNNQDGKTFFNFSNATQQLIATKSVFSSQLVRISYFENLNDALSEINAIPDISNYKNSTPWEQKIYIRIDSDDVNACLGLNHVITLHVEKLPVATPVSISRQCDDDDNGLFPFDTSTIEASVKNGQTDIIVSYFDENNIPLPSPLPNPFLTKSQIITIKVENSTSTINPACFDETTLEFIVDVAPKIYPVNIPALCDDGANTTDGISGFDTSTIETQLLGSQTGMQVRYVDENNVALPSPLPNPFSTKTQKVTATISNVLNSACTIASELSFVVNPLPNFEVEKEQIICLNLTPKLLEVHNADGIYTYEWYDENLTLLGQADYQPITKGGIYSVFATSNLGCVSLPRTITVEESIIASISDDDITIVDDSDNNSITIKTENNNLGVGDYEFALNDMYGFYQDEPYFEQVPAGIHTIFVRDKNNCGIAQINVSVVGFPRFFTPNNDGYNDVWKVLGVNSYFYPSSNISIFNRFGKLITQFTIEDNGWDGFFNGKQLISNDYWFSLELIDRSGFIRIKKGHFSLIRR